MKIGVLKEVKNHESRVGLTPQGTAQLVAAGHSVVVQRSAGAQVGFADQSYSNAGAELQDEAPEILEKAELIVKVKEPLAHECAWFKPHHILFTYLHLSANPSLTERLIQSGATCIAYETVTNEQGGLPLLLPMSEIAGRLAAQKGAQCLESLHGTPGVLLGGVPGVPAASVVIIGGGTVGANAARIALGLGARVTILDSSLAQLRFLAQHFDGQVDTVYSQAATITEALSEADLAIGAVLIPGAAAPKIVGREQISAMKPGSVIVDVAIDQGGCFATSRPTTHEHPTFWEEGVLHYCVTNMPGCVARTATLALTNATLPYIMLLADQGLAACDHHPGLANGVNIRHKALVCEAVAESFCGAVLGCES